MAVSKPEPPGKRQAQPLGAGSSSSSSGGFANRPILLKAKAPPDKIPEPDYDDDEDEDQDDLRLILRNAPAWLVSTVFHMLVLIVLGLLAVTAKFKSADVDVEVSSFAESLGTQLEDPTVTSGDSAHVEGVGTEQMITPRDLPPVEDPFAAPPNLGEIKLGAIDLGPAGPDGRAAASSNVDAPMIGMALKGRSVGSRNVLLGKYGGTATTEEAVERGLEWLVKNQRADGLWSLMGPYPDGSFVENTVASTAMALLAFQGHGDTHRDGKYAKTVARGWKALLRLQGKDGGFGRDVPERSQQLYTHAQCTIALCELYGMTHDSQYRVPAEHAIAYAVAAQDPKKGGWRYAPREDSDTSVTGWFVMALQSARMAGLKVPEEALTKVSEYLDSAQIDEGRRYGYWGGSSPTPAVCAEGLLCRQYLGWKQNDPRLVEGVSALNQIPVDYGGPNRDVYYWYYATQAAHHMEGKIWDDWNKIMRQEVPAHQVKAGPQAGSWDPQGDKWGGVGGGRLYVTCLSIYVLEVYYRHLPIYSGYKYVPDVEPSAPAAKNEAESKQPSEAKGK